MPDSAAFDADVLIVGAGPAGLVLSVALAQAGLRSRVLEQAPRDALAQPVEDGRDIAMTYRSRRIFDRLGLWQRLPQDDIAPLKAAQVTDGDSPRPLRFDGLSGGHEQLGWLVPNYRIRRACFDGAMACGDRVRMEGDARVTTLARDARGASLTLADGRRWRAPLVVAADSRFSTLRRLAGSLVGLNFIHEDMAVPAIRRIAVDYVTDDPVPAETARLAARYARFRSFYPALRPFSPARP